MVRQRLGGRGHHHRPGPGRHFRDHHGRRQLSRCPPRPAPHERVAGPTGRGTGGRPGPSDSGDTFGFQYWLLYIQLFYDTDVLGGTQRRRRPGQLRRRIAATGCSSGPSPSVRSDRQAPTRTGQGPQAACPGIVESPPGDDRATQELSPPRWTLTRAVHVTTASTAGTGRYRSAALTIRSYRQRRFGRGATHDPT